MCEVVSAMEAAAAKFMSARGSRGEGCVQVIEWRR